LHAACQVGTESDRAVRERQILTTSVIVRLQNGHLRVVQLLAEKQADLRAKNAHNNTALRLASGYNQVEVVKFLLQAGIPVDQTGYNQNTSLHWAADQGRSLPRQVSSRD